MLADAGAYPGVGALLPTFTGLMAPGNYDIENVAWSGHRGGDQHRPDAGFPGGGSPRGHRGHRAGGGPVRGRDRHGPRRGAPSKLSRPRRLPAHHPHRRGLRLRGLPGVAGGRAGGGRLRRASGRAGRSPGSGATIGCWASGCPPMWRSPRRWVLSARRRGSLELRPDGTVLARTGATPFGQGHVTTLSMVVADTLGIDMDRIEVVHGDTDEIPSSDYNRRVSHCPDRRLGPVQRLP